MIEKMVKALQGEDYPAIQATLDKMLKKKDDDLLIIIIRESVASGLLTPGTKKATVAAQVILDHQPRRSLLAHFARRLGDGSMANFILPWMDSVLARNVRMEPEEWAEEWSQLDSVKEVRRILAAI